MIDDAQDQTAPSSGPDPVPVSPAETRFYSCRWHQPAEGTVTAHCTHREVRPLAGVSGFSPEAWCPGCAYFKVRRTARKPIFNE